MDFRVEILVIQLPSRVISHLCAVDFYEIRNYNLQSLA